MRSSVIDHPKDEPLIIVRKWQLEFCEGNTVAAALLSFFEHWHNIRLSTSRKNKKVNEVAQAHGDEGTADISLYQWHTETELKDGLMRIAKSPKTIKNGLDCLVEKGVISIHKNPKDRYKFDKTRYFLFYPDVVNRWLDFTYRSSKNTLPSGKNELPSGKNDGTIPKITTKIASKTPYAGAKNGGDFSKKQKQDTRGLKSGTTSKNKVGSEISAPTEKGLNPIVSLVDQTLTEFLRVTGWPMPTAKNRVLQYKKSIADHLDEKAFEGRLPDIYQAVWDQKREAIESGDLTLSAPGSFTNFMYNITNVEASVREPSLNSLMNEGLVEMQEREPGVVTLVWVETGEIYDI